MITNTIISQNNQGQNIFTGMSGKTGGSMSGMQALIAADSAMKLSKSLGKTATEMEGRARVTESEIKLDKAHGMDTTKKEEELEDLKDRVAQTKSSQLSTLSEASKTLENADWTSEKTEYKKKDDKETSRTQAKESTSEKKETGKTEAAGVGSGTDEGDSIYGTQQKGEEAAQNTKSTALQHIDMKL